MAVPFSNTKLRVPRGFQNLLEGLAREVLRNQPDNIHAFAAIYFDNLLRIREQQGTDPAEIGAKHEDRYYNNKAFQSGNIGDVTDPQQQEAAVKIQSVVRGHQSRESTKPDSRYSEEDAALKIQTTYRGYEARKRVQALKEGQADAQAEGETQEPDTAATESEKPEEVDINLNDSEVEKAALKIQSSFKGLETRKNLSNTAQSGGDDAQTTEMAEPSQQEGEGDTSQVTQEEPQTDDSAQKPQATEEEVDIDLEDPEVKKAAIKIQSGFKGMMARKGVKQKKEGTQDEAQPDNGTEPVQEEQVAETTEAAQAEEGAEGEKQEQEQEVDIDWNDPQVQDAAVKIQAGFKGMKARKEVKQLKDSKSDSGMPPPEQAPQTEDAPQTEEVHEAPKEPTEETPQEGKEATKADPPKPEGQEEEEVDIDLADPDVQDAALKIQAGFRGIKARKEVKDMKTEKAAAAGDKPEGS